jgi:hypothetical protein
LAALDIVRQGADVMPKSQLNQVLDAELGADWSTKLTSFDYEPVAAASIGQVKHSSYISHFYVQSIAVDSWPWHSIHFCFDLHVSFQIETDRLLFRSVF